MRTILVIAILLVSMTCPPVSHGFGLLRYTFDAVRNQLGLDRGPIPKLTPGFPHACFDPPCPSPGKHPDAHRIYIQAEGF